MHPRTRAHIRGVFEAEGIIFIDPSAMSAWGDAGVRLSGDSSKSPMGKLFDAIWALPDTKFMAERAYGAVLNILDQYLDILQNEHREPDVWERINLCDALRMLDHGEVQYAVSDFETAITPPDNQSKVYLIPTGEAAKVANLDAAWFRKAVAELRGRGYQRSHQ